MTLLIVPADQAGCSMLLRSTRPVEPSNQHVLAKYQVHRNITLSVPGFHALPMVIRNSDLVAIVPAMLAEEYASHVPIKVLPMPVPVPPFDLRGYWHDRYHHDAPIRWLRKVFVELFRSGARACPPGTLPLSARPASS